MLENRMKLTFFDDYWVDFRRKTTRRWFAPELFSQCPSGCYASLCYDPERKKYLIFYEEMVDVGKDGPRLLKLLESEDMVHFRHVLNDEGGEVVFDGDGGVHGASVLYDPLDKDPSRRFKFCGMTRLDRDREGATSHIEVVLAFSPDGVHWEHRPDLVANPHTSDALNKLFYNPYTEEYNLLHRSAFVDRRISIRSSKDLVTWSDPRIILHPGATYNDGFTEMQHYSLSAKWFDGIFYGLLWRYNTSLYDDDYTKMFGVMEPELVYSYDGQEFLYTSGKPLMERPMAPQPGWAGLSPQDMCESRDGKYYYLLVGGSMFVHGTAESNKKLHDWLAKQGIRGGQLIYRIRKDGFCGIESVGQGGTVITKGLELMEDDLTFNVRAACGSVRFGLMDKAGKFLDGFSFDDCVPFEFGDDVAVRPEWKTRKLGEVLNQQLRVAVELNGAVLHAMSGTARPHIRQRQKSFADPRGLYE